MNSLFTKEIKSFCFSSDRLNEEEDLSVDNIISITTQMQTQLKSLQTVFANFGFQKTSNALRTAIINLETAKSRLQTTSDISEKVNSAGTIIEIVAGCGIFLSSIKKMVRDVSELISDAPSDASINSFLETKEKSLEDLVETYFTPDESSFNKVVGWTKKATQSLAKAAERSLQNEGKTLSEGIGAWLGNVLAKSTRRLVGGIGKLLDTPQQSGSEVAKYLRGENIFNTNIANALINDLNNTKINELNSVIADISKALSAQIIPERKMKNNNHIFKIMFEEYDRYLKSLCENIDIFDKQGNIIIGKDLKVVHVPTGFEYTVDDVVDSPKGVSVILRKPDVARPGALAISKSDAINEDDDEPYQTSEDGETFSVSQKEFEKNYQEA